MADSKQAKNGEYNFDSFVLTYTICDGLILDFAGYTDVIQPIKDEITKHKDSCKAGITKPGHDSTEQQCDYQGLNIKVTSGERVGWTHRSKRPEGSYDIKPNFSIDMK